MEVTQKKANIEVIVDADHKFIELKGNRGEPDSTVLVRLVLGVSYEKPIEGALLTVKDYRVIRKQEIMGLTTYYEAEEVAINNGEKYHVGIKNRTINISRPDNQEIPEAFVNCLTDLISQANEQVRYFRFEGGEAISIGKSPQTVDIRFGASRNGSNFFPYHLRGTDLNQGTLQGRGPHGGTQYALGDKYVMIRTLRNLEIVRVKDINRQVYQNSLKLPLRDLARMGIESYPALNLLKRSRLPANIK